MKRLTTLFSRLRRERRCGVIAYLTCGDPDVESTVAIVRELESAGADAIELGVPFSDPIADGPVIQAASYRALRRGVTIHDLFTIAKAIRETSSIPLVAFSYLNPIMAFGVERFAAEAAASGIDALLLTDLPPEASSEMRAALKASGLGLVCLLAPTSPPARVRLVDRVSEGFIYYVSTTGVTGTRSELDPGLAGRLDELRGALKQPLAVGFGISTRDHYLQLSAHADAVVVGSAIVRAIADGDTAGAAVRAGDVIRGWSDRAGSGM